MKKEKVNANAGASAPKKRRPSLSLRNVPGLPMFQKRWWNPFLALPSLKTRRNALLVTAWLLNNGEGERWRKRRSNCKFTVNPFEVWYSSCKSNLSERLADHNDVSEETIESFACAFVPKNSALNSKWAMRVTVSTWNCVVCVVFRTPEDHFSQNATK